MMQSTKCQLLLFYHSSQIARHPKAISSSSCLPTGFPSNARPKTVFCRLLSNQIELTHSQSLCNQGIFSVHKHWSGQRLLTVKRLPVQPPRHTTADLVHCTPRGTKRASPIYDKRSKKQQASKQCYHPLLLFTSPLSHTRLCLGMLLAASLLIQS